MAIADLASVLKIFGGGDVGEDEQNELFKEVLLMTLARAANADVNIQTVEVDRIRKILKEHTGEDFSAGDVRVAERGGKPADTCGSAGASAASRSRHGKNGPDCDSIRRTGRLGALV